MMSFRREIIDLNVGQRRDLYTQRCFLQLLITLEAVLRGGAADRITSMKGLNVKTPPPALKYPEEGFQNGSKWQRKDVGGGHIDLAA